MRVNADHYKVSALRELTVAGGYHRDPTNMYGNMAVVLAYDDRINPFSFISFLIEALAFSGYWQREGHSPFAFSY